MDFQEGDLVRVEILGDPQNGRRGVVQAVGELAVVVRLVEYSKLRAGHVLGVPLKFEKWELRRI